MIWESACGDGAISRELEAHGHHVVSTDLIDRGYGQGGCDFLNPATATRVALDYPAMRHIVTNPPYSYQLGIADKFVGMALRVSRHTGGTVAMLLNLGSLAHPTRTSKWSNSPPAAIYAIDELVCWPRRSPLAGSPNRHRPASSPIPPRLISRLADETKPWSFRL